MADLVHAQIEAILKLPQIRGKMVILCEGEGIDLDVRPSPQMYARTKLMPDANFYRSCIPRAWRSHRLPVFFNCGSRAEVLKTFTGLLAAHHEAREASYLTPTKLYALVDLDLHVAKLPPEAGAATTEDLHRVLYARGALRHDLGDDHRIFVTSLIHKEAFYLLPGLAPVILEAAPQFQGQPLTDLCELHQSIAQRVATDPDFAQHLSIARDRLRRGPAGTALTCTDGQSLAAAWLQVSQPGGPDYGDLVATLLTVAKAKPVWSKLCPPPYGGRSIPESTYREQLALAIARHIANLQPTEHPLAALFAYLEPRR